MQNSKKKDSKIAINFRSSAISNTINIKKYNYSKIDQLKYLQNKTQQTKPESAYALLSWIFLFGKIFMHITLNL